MISALTLAWTYTQTFTLHAAAVRKLLLLLIGSRAQNRIRM